MCGEEGWASLGRREGDSSRFRGGVCPVQYRQGRVCQDEKKDGEEAGGNVWMRGFKNEKVLFFESIRNRKIKLDSDFKKIVKISRKLKC